MAQDHALERRVALKEYMPGSLAGRGQGPMVSIRSGAHTETYALGLRSFVNEARLLARFNHPSLVKVYRFWEENGTAYMVMPYLQGRTLRDVRWAMKAPPAEAWMRSVISPLLDALDQLHREDVYHRDIAPDNILLPPGELPVLLDFGAARRAIGDRTQTFTAILKPSYAPIEQYAEVVQLRQGPWTDLYALGAVVYYLLHGAPPPPATARAVQDDASLLSPARHPGISPAFIAAFEWALAIRPGDRPQNIAALRDVLDGRAAVPPRVRSGTTAPAAALHGADAPTFAPTLQIELTVVDEDTIVPTRPMTAPPRMLPPAPPLRTAPPAHRDATTVMPSRPTVDEPARRAGSGARWSRLAVGFGIFVAVAATAAWMAGSRTSAPPATPVIAAPPAAAPVEAAATPATVPPTPVAAAPSAPATPAVARLQRPAVKPAPRAAHEDPSPPPPTSGSDETARATLGIPAPTPPAANVREGPGSPKEACGARVFLALALCMEEQCERPRFKGHPQCKKVHDLLERRRRGESGD